MSDDAPAPAMDPPTAAPPAHVGGKGPGASTVDRSSSATDVEHDRYSIDEPPMSPRPNKNPFSRVQTSLDVDDYFVCLRVLPEYSKFAVAVVGK
jgi:hypothetical protein